MFNVKKAVEKLDELGVMSKVITSNSVGEMTEFSTHKSCTMFELREILLAGQSDRTVANNEDVRALEQRIARLEEAVKLIQFDNDIEPEKPVTEEKPITLCEECCKIKYVLDDRFAQGKFERGMFCHCQTEPVRKDDKPSECVPHACVSDGMVYTSNPPQHRCKICGKFWYV